MKLNRSEYNLREKNKKKSTPIVGGGISGLGTAHYLNRYDRSLKIMIIDTYPSIESLKKASSVNCGIISAVS